jgi:hypothetical protein
MPATPLSMRGLPFFPGRRVDGMIGTGVLMRFTSTPESLLFVDTGLAGAGCTATKPTLDAAGITLDIAAAGTGTGGGGAVAVIPFTVDRLALGSAVKRDVRGLYTPQGSPLSALFPFTPGGLISHQFFLRYAPTLDFVRMQIVLTP